MRSSGSKWISALLRLQSLRIGLQSILGVFSRSFSRFLINYFSFKNRFIPKFIFHTIFGKFIPFIYVSFVQATILLLNNDLDELNLNDVKNIEKYRNRIRSV